MAVSVPATATIYENLTQNAYKYQGMSKYDDSWVRSVRARSFSEIRDQLAGLFLDGQTHWSDALDSGEIAAAYRNALAVVVETPRRQHAAAQLGLVAVEPVLDDESVEREEDEKEMESVVDPVVVGKLSLEVEAKREGDETVAAELRREEENQDLPALVPTDSGADVSEPCRALVAVNVECCAMLFVEEAIKVEMVVEKKQKKWTVSSVVSRAKHAVARLLPRRNNRVQAI
ncbi:hypothetical protein GGF32_004727 [Allomyces javanicus]|nr:hypothetical protein GGF32_004727 [Allomyces javanicus]